MRGKQATLSWQTGTVVLLGYLALSVLFFGRTVLGHLDSHCVCVLASDPMQYVWSFQWLPHAIGEGQNPILTHSMWAPGPFDLADTTWVPLASLVAIPFTLTLGPLAAYNILVLASPAIAAFFTFRLCNYLTGRLAPSLVGGFLFGFSSYLVGQMIGHMHLFIVFLIPLAVDLVVRRMDGAIGKRHFVLALAAVVVGQTLISTEILFTALLFGTVGLLAGYAFADVEGRVRVRQVMLETVLGGIVGAVVVSPYLYYALIYESPPPLIAGSRFSMDALNPLVPTGIDKVGGTKFLPVSETFEGAFVETGGYFGIAIVLLAGWWLLSTWRSRASRVLLATIVCAGLAALGISLHIAGIATIWLPWQALAGLPIFEQVIPTRLAMYIALPVAIAVALALAAKAPSRGWAALRWGLAVVGLIMLVPSGGSASFQSDPPDPSFFTSGEYKQYIDHEETVLALPWAAKGFSLLWQARADMWFRLAGGYLAQQPPPSYFDEPATALLYSGEANAETPCTLKTFIENRKVGAVVLEAASSEPWRPALAELGMRPRELGGVDFFDVPQKMRTPPACS